MKEDIKVHVNEEKIEEIMRARGMESSSLTAAERKELTNRFGAMSKEELEFIVDLIPVELCLGRVRRELEKARAFEDKVKSAMASLS